MCLWIGEGVETIESKAIRESPLSMGYGDAGASYVRKALKAFIAQSGSPRDDIDTHNFTLRQRGRMLYMAAPIATAAIRTTCTNVVGVGLAMKSRIDREALGLSPEQAKAWQRQTEAEWKLWAGKKQCCDAIGVCNFDEMQKLALMSALMAGDCFALLPRVPVTPVSPYSLRVKVVEADLVSTPDALTVLPGTITEAQAPNGNFIYDGVEVDKDTSAIVAYHFCNRYPFEVYTIGETRKWQRVLAYGEKTGLPNVLHIMEPERAGQYRGVTFLAPVIEQLLQIRRYTESELMAALVQSFFTAWIETEADPATIPMNEVGGEEQEISHDPNEYEMGSGSVIHLRVGEKVKFGNPNIPTAGFDVFVKTFCKLIGAGLGIPYDVLIKEYNSSYSSARAALLDAWEDFRMRRKWFVDDFCQPTYEVWLAEAVARGRVKAPGFFGDPLIRAAWCGARWIGPVQGSLDPLKEAKAAVLQIQHALRTHEQVTRETGGGDWDENVEQLAAENAKLAAAGGGGIRIEVDPNEKDDDEGGGENAQTA